MDDNSLPFALDLWISVDSELGDKFLESIIRDHQRALGDSKDAATNLNDSEKFHAIVELGIDQSLEMGGANGGPFWLNFYSDFTLAVLSSYFKHDGELCSLRGTDGIRG